MGKILVVVAGLLFLGVFRLATADLDGVRIPFLSPASAGSGAALASAQSLGTPAAVTLPDGDPTAWFPGGSATDSPALEAWPAILAFAGAAGTPSGWAEACAKVSAVAGADRAANLALGVLACSDDATVATLQRFALELLSARGELVLWSRGVSGHDTGMVAGRIAEVRNACENGLPSRMGAESAYGQACTAALAATELPGDAVALESALAEAYTLVAMDLASRDPEIDAAPSGLDASAAPTAAAGS